MRLKNYYLRFNTEPEQEQGGGAPEPNYQELAEQLQAEKAAMQNKLDELLSETKAAKAARREAEAKAQAEAEAIARKQGDFEQLHKSSEERYNMTLKELEELRQNVANEKVQNTAIKVATELADGANAEILSEFISRRLTYTDNGIKVTNDNGELTVATLADLAKEFKDNSRYASLIRGNQSTGGGATGSNSAGSAGKEITRQEFSNLHPAKRMEFIKKGGTITD